jgi:hypothetical protein
MQLKVINSFLAKTVLDDDVIGLTPLKAGRYPIKAIEDEQYEVIKSKARIWYFTSHVLELVIKSRYAVIINV